MRRRDFLKSAGGIGGLAVGGAGALLANDNATVAAQTNIETERLAAESASGIVDDVYLWLSGSVWWSGMPQPPSQVQVKLTVGDHPKFNEGVFEAVETLEITDIPSAQTIEDPIPFEAVGGSLCNNTPFTRRDFSATQDGAANVTAFTARSEVYVDGEVARLEGTRQPHPVEVRVENTDDYSTYPDQLQGVKDDIQGNVTMR